MYVFGPEILGILMSVEFVQVLTGVFQFGGAGNDEREVGDKDDAFKVGHFVGVDHRGNHVAYKKELGLGVVDDVVNLFGVEFVEYRNSNGSIGERC